MNQLKNAISVPLGKPHELSALIETQRVYLICALHDDDPWGKAAAAQARVEIDYMLDRWPDGRPRSDIELNQAHTVASECGQLAVHS